MHSTLQFDEGVNLSVYDDMQNVAGAAVAKILNAATSAISERGRFHIVLAGGTTPKLAYQSLANTAADWRCWHIYYGDERALPADDPARNSVMAQQAWLDHVTIPPDQIHPIPAELGVVAGAAAYRAVIAEAIPFDMVLLGMGEDGHTASLFPGHRHNEEELVHTVDHAPKPPSGRISLSCSSLAATRQLVFMVTGESKQVALQQWASGDELPVASIHPHCPIELLIDRQAAGDAG